MTPGLSSGCHGRGQRTAKTSSPLQCVQEGQVLRLLHGFCCGEGEVAIKQGSEYACAWFQADSGEFLTEKTRKRVADLAMSLKAKR